MTIIKIPIKKNSDKNLDDNKIIFFKNKSKLYITSYLINNVREVNKKVIYFAYSYSKNELLKTFKELNNKNIIIVDDISTTFEDIEQYIIDNKPNYIYIDHFKLTSTKKYLYIEDKKFKYVLDKIEYYTKKYNVKFLIVLNKEDKIKNN